MKNSTVKNLALSSMFLAIGLVLPFFTGQIPQVGKMLLPMHIPGIILQLIAIPAIMVALNRTGLVHFRQQKPVENKHV